MNNTIIEKKKDTVEKKTPNLRRHGNSIQIDYMKNGKRHYETFKCKADAKARLREIKSSKPANKKRGSITLLDFVKSQLASTINIKDTTRSSYESILVNYVLPLLGSMRLTEILPPDVQRFIDDLRNCGLAPKTIKNICCVLSIMMNRAVRLGLIDYNPCINAKLPTVHPYIQTQVLDDDYEHFLQLCKEAPDGELYIIAITTGMRLGELIGLKWCDIDFSNCTINICRQLQLRRTESNGQYQEDTLKNYKSRNITVAPAVINILKRIFQAQNYLRSRGELDNKEGFVFVGADGTHLKKSTIDKHFRTFVQTHPELPQKLRFHDLRGSFVTRSLDLNISPKTVSHNAGHYSVGFTLDKYGRVSKYAQTHAAEIQQQDLACLLA